jgi:hypothetical protein
MACENPYYDRSATTGGSGGSGSVDLSDYPKKTEVKDYDQVENYTADTKDQNTIYIKDNATLWVYNGTEYVNVSANDMTMIPISRLNKTENVEPASSEYQGVTLSPLTFAVIHLSNGVVEYWQYDGTAWSKKLRIARSTKTFLILRDSTQEDIAPTTTEIDSFTPIDGDRALIHLSTSEEVLNIVEKWEYSGGWTKTKKTEAPKTFKTKELNNTASYTVTKLMKTNTFIARCTSADTNITLPDVADMQDKVLIFKLDNTEAGHTYTITPNGGDYIGNSNSPVTLVADGDFLTIISDGDEWHVISSKITGSNTTAHTVPRYKSTDGTIEETEVIIDSNNNILTTGIAIKFTRGLTAGITGEVNNSLVNFGTNFSQLGNVDNTKDSAFIRVDTRGGSHSTELFTLFHANAGGTQKALFKIGDNGKVYAKSLDVDGYTRLGASSPAIKMKIISGITPTTQGGSVRVLHGLTASKIIGAYHQVIYYKDERVYNLYDGIGWKTKIWSDEDEFILRTVENESASVLGKPFDIVVMYKE